MWGFKCWFPILNFCHVFYSHNLYHIVDFPTRFNNTSYSTIDNICTDNFRPNLLKVFPIINGLSDHDAQYLTLNNLFLIRFTT